MLLISINNRLVKTLSSLTLIGVLAAFLFACGGGGGSSSSSSSGVSPMVAEIEVAEIEPPPIVRTEPFNLQEVLKIGSLGTKALNDQVIRYGLARFTPLIPDWSKANSGKLLASWTTTNTNSKQPTIVFQHGGYGGPGSTDYGHARWFLAQGFNVLVLDSFWSRGFIANWLKFDETYYGSSFSTLGANTRAQDAFAAARWLRDQPQVDSNRIYLVGGSQGGWSVLRAFTDEQSITDKNKGLFRAGVSITPACWSWQQTPAKDKGDYSETFVPRLGPFYAPVFITSAEFEPPGSQTDINSCDPNLIKSAAKYIRFANMTHDFDSESPAENPINQCSYSPNPNWCTSSGGRDPATGYCIGTTKPDICSDLVATKSLRNEMLAFLNSYK